MKMATSFKIMQHAGVTRMKPDLKKLVKKIYVLMKLEQTLLLMQKLSVRDYILANGYNQCV